MVNNKQLHLFEAIGIELEYMIADRETLDVQPIADEVIRQVAGKYVNEIERGTIAWSNELVMHVIELKTNGPVQSLSGLYLEFQEQVDRINELLETYHAALLPTAMHPWMDPFREMKLWPHEYNPIYEAYNRIFGCRGHGWANLQSTHINLPFHGDHEFEKLHAAIRVLLPILPGIAASSPFADGRKTGYHDYRMEVYRTNSLEIPSVTGYIVPEAVFTRNDYEQAIFQQMYRDIAPHDPKGILQEEWLNSRGAIARFDRNSIEIRVLDVQESPLADISLVRLIVDTLKALVEERFATLEEQKSWNEKRLYEILLEVVRVGEFAQLENQYAQLFGVTQVDEVTVGKLWQNIFDNLYTEEQVMSDPLLLSARQILNRGTLSSGMINALPEQVSRKELAELYRALGTTLSQGKLFCGYE